MRLHILLNIYDKAVEDLSKEIDTTSSGIFFFVENIDGGIKKGKIELLFLKDNQSIRENLMIFI